MAATSHSRDDLMRIAELAKKRVDNFSAGTKYLLRQMEEAERIGREMEEAERMTPADMQFRVTI